MIDYKGLPKLDYWQRKYTDAKSAWELQRAKMDRREALYSGSDSIRPVVPNDETLHTVHVRNVVSEMIEAQVNSDIPQPKVTAIHEKDRDKARLIEAMIRNECDRLPMRELNDMMERTVPIQGMGVWLIDWDDSDDANRTKGDIYVEALHPKQIVPQDGVYTSVEDMDYVFIVTAQTKSYIKERYGVDVDMESEAEPDVRTDEASSVTDDLVTLITVYYREDKGVIGRYSWVNDVEVEDYEDYRARTVERCNKCGKRRRGGDEDKCQCGGRFVRQTEESEELIYPIQRRDGVQIGGLIPTMDGVRPTEIPYYKPITYPIVIQKNVSTYGQLPGESDVDKIATQQNTINRMEQKIIDRLVKAGTRITLPEETYMTVDPDDASIWRITDASQKQLIDVYEFDGNLQYEMAYLSNVYEEARQLIGITDSFQGRRDTTATSAVAKEFAAKQSAGRMESKRVLKQGAWSKIFEMIFKLKLAYSDEPRPVISRDYNGNEVYEQFNRYDFLEWDEERQEWYYNDCFLFSCDSAAPLIKDRQALWQETRMNLQTGAFGNPQDPSALILFWTKMEQYDYPGAGEVRAYMEQKQQEAAQQQAMMQQQQAMQAQMAQEQQQMAQQPSGLDNAVYDAIAQANA